MGAGDAAVVGFNAQGSYFHNHQLSGFTEIGCALNGFNNCTASSAISRKKRSPGGSLDCLPTDPVLRDQINMCLDRITSDENTIGDESVVMGLANELEPCPHLRRNAEEDCGRFRPQASRPECFVSTYTIERTVASPRIPGLSTRLFLTQQCCYDNEG